MQSFHLKAPTECGAEITVWVVVTHFSAYLPMRITGSGFGDADPPEPEEIEWHLATHEDGPLSEALQYHAGILTEIVDDILSTILNGREAA